MLSLSSRCWTRPRRPTTGQQARNALSTATVCLHCGTVVRVDDPELGVLEVLPADGPPVCSHGVREAHASCVHPDECRLRALRWATVHLVKTDGRRVWEEQLTPVGLCLHCGRMTESFLRPPVMRRPSL